jgi:hypothetical protein
MTVGQSGHDQLASPIDNVCIRRTRHDLIGRTNGCDEIFFDGNRGIEVNGRVAISSHNRGVMNDGRHAALISKIGAP